MLLAVDPGIVRPGAALFLDGKLLVAGLVKLSDGSDRGGAADAYKWVRVAQDIVTWARYHCTKLAPNVPVDRIVFERPYVYPKSKANPNDLICLAGVGTAVAAILLGYFPELDVMSPLPREWTGQISKVCPSCGGKAKKKCVDCHGSAWETPRGRRIRSRLSPAEFAVCPDQNDAIDAVGLGLFAEKRLEVVRVFSNGR